LKANKMSWIITDLIWNSHFQHSSTLKVKKRNKKRKFNSELNNLKRERERERERERKLLFTYLDKVYNGLCIESKTLLSKANYFRAGRSISRKSLTKSRKKKWSWNNEKWSSLFL
jgi:hypothetical protein